MWNCSPFIEISSSQPFQHQTFHNLTSISVKSLKSFLFNLVFPRFASSWLRIGCCVMTVRPLLIMLPTGYCVWPKACRIVACTFTCSVWFSRPTWWAWQLRSPMALSQVRTVNVCFSGWFVLCEWRTPSLFSLCDEIFDILNFCWCWCQFRRCRWSVTPKRKKMRPDGAKPKACFKSFKTNFSRVGYVHEAFAKGTVIKQLYLFPYALIQNNWNIWFRSRQLHTFDEMAVWQMQSRTSSKSSRSQQL